MNKKKVYIVVRVEKDGEPNFHDPQMENFSQFNEALNYATDMKRHELRDNYRYPAGEDQAFLRWIRSEEYPISSSNELLEMYWNDIADDVTVIARYDELYVDEGWKVLEAEY